MRRFAQFVLVMVLLAVGVRGLADGKKYPGTKKDLVGRWVSKSISGDALFFVVSQIEGRLDKDGKYTGKVNFTDFQTSSQDGRYEVDGSHILIYAPGTKKPYKLLFWFEDEKKTKLTVRDEHFGVSLTLNKGGKGKGDGGSLLDDL